MRSGSRFGQSSTGFHATSATGPGKWRIVEQHCSNVCPLSFYISDLKHFVWEFYIYIFKPFLSKFCFGKVICKPGSLQVEDERCFCILFRGVAHRTNLFRCRVLNEPFVRSNMQKKRSKEAFVAFREALKLKYIPSSPLIV